MLRSGKTIVRLFIVMMIFAFLSSCKDNSSGTGNPEIKERPELLIYCGMTMISPMMEIAKIIEQEKNCTIEFIYGGSLHLKRAIDANKQGDIYFPGDESFLISMEKESLILDTVQVGYNQAAIMVQKGNPKQITNDLKNFVNPGYAVVVGAQKSGSIGRETKRIFTALDMYEQVLSNALYLTTDSKGLSKAIRNQEADLVLNWKATAFLPENKPFIDVLPLDAHLAPRRTLVLGLLTYSKHKDLSRRFMEFSGSTQGQEIFRRYGFLD
jgi:molybdate transport system substrate-binding protein